MLAVAMSCSALLTAAYLRRLTGPLERLSGAIRRIADTGDLSLRAPVEYRDEIGDLAGRFNVMVSSLEAQNLMLSAGGKAEREARDMNRTPGAGRPEFDINLLFLAIYA